MSLECCRKDCRTSLLWLWHSPSALPSKSMASMVWAVYTWEPLGLLASHAAWNPCGNAWPGFSPVTEQPAPALFLVGFLGSQADQVMSLVEGSDWRGQPPGALLINRQGSNFQPLPVAQRGHLLPVRLPISDLASTQVKTSGCCPGREPLS